MYADPAEGVASESVTPRFGAYADVFFHWCLEASLMSAIVYGISWQIMRRRRTKQYRLPPGAHVAGFLMTTLAAASVRMGAVVLFGGSAGMNPTGPLQLFYFLVIPAVAAITFVLLVRKRIASGASTGAQAHARESDAAANSVDPQPSRDSAGAVASGVTLQPDRSAASEARLDGDRSSLAPEALAAGRPDGRRPPARLRWLSPPSREVGSVRRTLIASVVLVTPGGALAVHGLTGFAGGTMRRGSYIRTEPYSFPSAARTEITVGVGLVVLGFAVRRLR